MDAHVLIGVGVSVEWSGEEGGGGRVLRMGVVMRVTFSPVEGEWRLHAAACGVGISRAT